MSDRPDECQFGNAKRHHGMDGPEVINAETSEDGPISYSITSYTDAAGNLGSSDGLLLDSKLEDITIDTKSPEITTVTFDILIKNNTSITSGTPGYDDARAQPNDTVIFKLHRMNRSTRYQQQISR